MPEIKKPERPLTRVEQLFAGGLEQGREGNLKEQYKVQVKALYEVGILELMSDGKNVGYVDINGTEKPLPSYNDIVQKLEANYELVEKRFKQGFTDFRLDLIGLPLDFLFKRIPIEIVKAHGEGRLKGLEGEELDFDTEKPFVLDESFKGSDISGDLLYGSTRIYKNGEEGGKTKQEYIESHPSGYLFRLYENDITGKVGRKQRKAKTPLEYQKELQEKGGSGETVDSAIIDFLIGLKLGRVTADFREKVTANWLTGNFLKGNRGIPFMSFVSLARRAALLWRSPEVKLYLGHRRTSAVI